MMKRLLALLILVAAFSTVGAKQAQACSSAIPVMGQLCKLAGDNTFLDAVMSRIQIYVETMLYTLKIESEKKYRIAESTLQQKAARQAAYRQDQLEHLSALSEEQCILPSAINAVLHGSVNTPPSLVGDNPTAPSMRTPAQKVADAKAAVGARPPLPTAVDAATGEPAPVGPGLAGTDTAGYPPEILRSQLVERQALNSQRRRQNGTPATSDGNIAALFDYNLRQSNYGPNQPVANFRDADISAATILLTKTFGADKNTPTPSDFTVGKIKTTVAPRTMLDAAYAYCTNLVDPTVLNPNRGEALNSDSARKSYAVQRAGWEARQSLASTICQDVVSKRAGKTVKADSAQGIYKIALEYRRQACEASSIAGADKAYLDCSAVVTDAATTDAAKAAQAAEGVKFASKFSEYEMMEILYSRLLPSLQGASLLGAASDADRMSHLLSVDQMMLALNFRIYELQERLNLIKAAQLAQLVENSKTGPGASAAAR